MALSLMRSGHSQPPKLRQAYVACGFLAVRCQNGYLIMTGVFAGGELAEEDMAEFTMAVQEAFFDAKHKNKAKYGKKNKSGRE